MTRFFFVIGSMSLVGCGELPAGTYTTELLSLQGQRVIQVSPDDDAATVAANTVEIQGCGGVTTWWGDAFLGHSSGADELIAVDGSRFVSIRRLDGVWEGLEMKMETVGGVEASTLERAYAVQPASDGGLQVTVHVEQTRRDGDGAITMDCAWDETWRLVGS